MTIKTKLFANMMLTIIGILVIGGFSLAGMKFVQSKLSVLTEQSTPYQLKTIELQRALQEHTSNLIKLATSTSMADFNATRSDAEKTLADVKTASGELAGFKSSGEGNNNSSVQELEGITTELFKTTQERLQAEAAGKAADALTKKKLQDIAGRLREMDGAMKTVQKSSMHQLSSSNDSVKTITQKVKNTQAATSTLNDVKIAILEISAADTKTALTVAKSHFTVAARLVTQSNLVKADKSGTVAKELTEGVEEITKRVTAPQGLLELKTSLLITPDEETKKKFTQAVAQVNQKLAQLTVIMGDTVEKAAEDFASEDKKFDSSLKGANSAGDIMASTSELIALGSDVSRLINELFSAATVQQLDVIKGQLILKFESAAAVQRRVAAYKSASGKAGQVGKFNSVAGSLNDIRGLLLVKDGAAEKLAHIIRVKAQAQALNDKLKDLVAKQREEGKKGVTSAQAEQEKAVKSVNRVFRTNITSVAIIALVVLVLGVVFSFGLVKSITSPIKELIDISEKFGNGDFTSSLDEKRKDEFGALAVHFNQATAKLKDITSQIREAIGNLAQNSNTLTATAEELSVGARQQATQTDQSASAMTEMTQTIQDVAHNAHEAAAETKNALDLAANGQKIVSETVQGMEEIAAAVRETAETIRLLGENSAKIGSVVDVINEIADQTNLLALNAAIEAARAGDAGMGFAVVADEVRKLAEKTGESTKEIAEMVAQIQANTQRSVKAMEKGTVKVVEGTQRANEANRSLESIVQASTRGVDMVQTIATAAEEQSAVAAGVSTSMEQIAAITRAAESSTSGITHAAEELNLLADGLNRMAEWFKMESTSQNVLKLPPQVERIAATRTVKRI
ncbi:MAG: methyl-accepting chemotaxis [Geobacteraceae bacterium]|nr:MAG: methyl-accepting chemotaxis [Geobacteraceae bacterium]